MQVNMHQDNGKWTRIATPGPALSFRTELVGLLGVTLMVAFFLWPVLDGGYALGTDTWKITYPWAAEGSIEAEEIAASLGDTGSDSFIPEVSYIRQYDFYLQSIPWYKFAKSELLAGRWPHWNPYAFCGEPFYAGHLVPLTHPPLIIALFTAPWEQVHNVNTFLTWWIGSLGLYLFLRWRRLQPAAALAAVALCLASGYYMRTQYIQMNALMYYPWIFWASEALNRKPSFRYLAPFAILLGLMMAGGLPAFFIPFIYLLLVYRIAIWIFDKQERVKWKKQLAFLLTGIILGAMVSAIQNVPTHQFLNLSARNVSQPPGITHDQEVVPENQPPPGTEDAPVLDARPPRAAILLAPVFRRRSVMSHPYVGFPLLLLALFGLYYLRPSPERKAMALVLVLFGITSAPPVFARVLHLIPGMAISPYPPIATTQFLMILLAGSGIHYMMGTDLTGDTKRKWIFTGLTVLSLAGYAALFIPDALLRPDTLWEERQTFLAWIVLITGLVAILAPAISWWFGGRREWTAGIILPLALTVAEIPGHFYQYPFYAKLPFMPDTPSIAALPDSPELRVAVHTFGLPAYIVSAEKPAPFAGNLPMWAGCYYAQGYNSMLLSRHSAVLNALDPATLLNGRNSLPLTDPDALSSPLLDAMAVGYLISDDPDLLDKPESGMDPSVWTRIHEGGLNIYERADAPKRWYIANQAVAASDIDEALSVLSASGLMEIAPDGSVIKKVVLETNEPVAESVEAGGPPGEITPVRETPGYLEFDVSVPDARWFVLSDAWHPEWHAFIDGTETEIYPANGAYRAVKIPEGEHSVIFRYVPGAFFTGLAISVISIVFLLMAAVIEGRRSNSA